MSANVLLTKTGRDCHAIVASAGIFQTGMFVIMMSVEESSVAERSYDFAIAAKIIYQKDLL